MPETPPRTWGRPSEMPSLGIIDRNTPTHVGKTCAREVQNSIREKHPHARGEDVKPLALTFRRPETPPRTWGRPGGRLQTLYGMRNTPTHVGKTFNSSHFSLHFWKHPHARGEDVTMQKLSAAGRETPPRTWGRRFERKHQLSGRRNTPTHVGKTLMHWMVKPSTWKHPHARGEDTWNLLAFFLLTFNKELGRHLNQKLKIFPFGRNTGLQAKKSNSSVDESLSPQCTWL